MRFFFFSSRRRHTRLSCDWSSDVCSSDLVDPPRIWAVHPRGDEFHPLSALEERAWRHRIGALQDRYRDGLAALGADFASLDGGAQDERLRANAAFTALLYDHACEGMYAAPAYGGN